MGLRQGTPRDHLTRLAGRGGKLRGLRAERLNQSVNPAAPRYRGELLALGDDHTDTLDDDIDDLRHAGDLSDSPAGEDGRSVRPIDSRLDGDVAGITSHRSPRDDEAMPGETTETAGVGLDGKSPEDIQVVRPLTGCGLAPEIAQREPGDEIEFESLLQYAAECLFPLVRVMFGCCRVATASLPRSSMKSTAASAVMAAATGAAAIHATIAIAIDTLRTWVIACFQ